MGAAGRSAHTLIRQCWLPVRQRITFKLAMTNFPCLHGLAPPYLADACIPVSSVVGRWQLPSADNGSLVVPRTRSTVGWRDFVVSGPATWNSRPVELRTGLRRSRSTRSRKKKSKLICWLPATPRTLYSFTHYTAFDGEVDAV